MQEVAAAFAWLAMLLHVKKVGGRRWYALEMQARSMLPRDPAQIRNTLLRQRRLLENPRRQYWRRNRATAGRKYSRIEKKARVLASQLFDATGEEL